MSNRKRLWLLLGWTLIGLAIGLVFGCIFWWRGLASDGATLADGLRGNVEDGLSSLQALLALGHHWFCLWLVLRAIPEKRLGKLGLNRPRKCRVGANHVASSNRRLTATSPSVGGAC